VTADACAFADDPAAFFGGSPSAMHTLPIADLVTLQRLALRHRFAELRDRVPVLTRMADEQHIEEIDELDDVVPLLFEHSVYKSFPVALIVRWFPGLGHDLMLEARTGRVVDALVAWLSSHVMADDGSGNGN
jgi:hypothetical protein